MAKRKAAKRTLKKSRGGNTRVTLPREGMPVEIINIPPESGQTILIIGGEKQVERLPRRIIEA